MGKAANNKKKAARKNRNNPQALTAPPVVTSAVSQQEKQNEAFPIVKKLSSLSLDDRAWAATALSNLVLDSQTRKKLLAANIVDALLRLLSDQAPEVALEAAGALRNLLVVGGDDVGGEVVRKNGLVPLLALVRKIAAVLGGEGETLEGEEVSEKETKKKEEEANNRRNIALDLAEQVVHTIWILVENLEKAVEIVCERDEFFLFGFLLQVLNGGDNVPLGLVKVAAQCLNTLTDENPSCYSLFTQNPTHADHLALIASGQISTFTSWDQNAIFLRPLSAGILHNIRQPILSSSPSPTAQTHLYTSIYSAIDAAFDFDLSAAIQSAEQIQRMINDKEIPQPMEGETVEVQDLVEEERKKMEVLEGQFGTVVFALEVLANVIVSEDGDVDENRGEEWEDMDGDVDEMEGDTNDDDDAIAMMESDTALLATIREASGNSMDTDSTDLDTKHALLLSTGIPTRLLSLLSTIIQVPPSPHTTTIHSRLLITLTNILTTPLAPHLVSTITTQQLFSTLLQTTTTHSEQLPQTLTFLTHLLKSSATPIHPSERETTHLLTLLNSPTEILSELIPLLSTLASQPTIPLPTNSLIMTTLLSLLPHSSVLITSIILDAFFDVYADASYPYDTVFISEGMENKLRSLQGEIRKMVKGVDRRKSRKAREMGDLAVVNLSGFLEYKMGERVGKE